MNLSEFEVEDSRKMVKTDELENRIYLIDTDPNTFRKIPLNASINRRAMRERIFIYIEKENSRGLRNQEIKKCLSAIQKDVNRPLVEEMQEHIMLQKGINFADAQYSTLPLAFADREEPKEYKVIKIKNRKIKI